MGNRVLVQFEDKAGRVSPVCYMHLADKTEAKLRECAELMKDRPDDLHYAFARFVGICHTHIEGNLSLGVWNQNERLKPDDTHGDEGCIVVNVSDWSCDQFGQYSDEKPRKFMLIDPEVEPD